MSVTAPPWIARLAQVAVGYVRWHRVDGPTDVVALVKTREDAVAIAEYPNVCEAVGRLLDEIDAAEDAAWSGLKIRVADVRKAAAKAMGRS